MLGKGEHCLIKSQAFLMTAVLVAHIQKSRPSLEKSDTMRCQHHISSCTIKKTGWHQCCHLKLVLHTQPYFPCRLLAAPMHLVISSLHRTDTFSLLLCVALCSFFRENADAAVLLVDLLNLPELKWGMCIFQNTLTHREISFLTDITDFKSALFSAVAPTDKTWQALWQWLQALTKTVGLLSALQQRATSRSLLKLVKHARSFTSITLLFSNFSGKKVFFTSIIILLIF